MSVISNKGKKRDLYELTPEHTAQLKPWADRWIANAMSCEAMDDADRAATREAVLGMYTAAKLAPPKAIVFVPSPIVLAFAGGFAAGIWYLAKNPQALGAATSAAATSDATYAATRAATRDATRASTRAATRDATYAATYDATSAATRDATYAATSDATSDATSAATRDATYAATSAATRDATYAATSAATRDATRAATRDATRASTRAATRDATYAATSDATSAATRAATRDATYAATSAATRDATRAATRDATRASTRAATRDATYAATSDATSAATRDATRDATYAATSAATRDATYAATSDATSDATYAATSDATSAATRDATYAATSAATRDATRDATYAATSDATSAATRSANERRHETLVRFLLACAANHYNMWDGGNQWSAYVSYLSFFRHVAALELPEYESFKHYETAAERAGPRTMHPDFCMVSDRPERILVDEQRRPHCEDGPSHCWRDGWALWHWHGVRVSRQVIEFPQTLTLEQIKAETNAEVRRIMRERFGEGRYLAETKARVIDVDGGNPRAKGAAPRVLLEDDQGDRVLVGTDGSTRRVYHMPVPKTAKTCREAHEAISGLSEALCLAES